MAKAYESSTRPATSAAERPGGFQAARTVALRELADQLTSLRFLIIALLTLSLTPLAVYVGTRDYNNRLQDFNRLAAEQQTLRAGSAGKSVNGVDDHFTPENELAVLRALRAPEPLSLLVRGLDGALPEYWDFAPTGVAAGPLASPPQRLADLLGQLDLEFLIRVALGLLAILLAFDAIVGEKEAGTLRVALSQPISRAALLTGKLTGGSVTLLLPLMMAFLAALLSARLFGVDLLTTDALAKIGFMAAISAAYLLCFYALGLLVSSLVASQKSSMVVLLVTWVLLALAVPPMATLMAQAISPTQPTHAVQAQKQAIDGDIRRAAELNIGAIYREITGVPENWMDTGKYTENKDVIDRRLAPILADYLSKRRQRLGEIERDVERRAARQNALARAIMALSPAAAFAAAVADVGSTGDAHHAAWIDAARRHQSRLDRVLFEHPPTVTIRNKGASTRVQLRPAPSISDLPAFAPPRRDATAAINQALPALGLLLLYTGIFIAGGFVAFARYDVR